MATAGLTSLLVAAQSPDANVRTQAEQQLTALQTSNYAELLVGLSAELADPSKPVDARRLAGLILKNTLDAKDEARKVGRRGKREITCPTLNGMGQGLGPGLLTLLGGGFVPLIASAAAAPSWRAHCCFRRRRPLPTCAGSAAAAVG